MRIRIILSLIAIVNLTKLFIRLQKFRHVRMSQFFYELSAANKHSYRVNGARTLARGTQDHRRARGSRRSWNNIHCLPIEAIRNNISMLTYISRRDGSCDRRKRHSKANSDETTFLTRFLTSTSRWTYYVTAWQPLNMTSNVEFSLIVSQQNFQFIHISYLGVELNSNYIRYQIFFFFKSIKIQIKSCIISFHISLEYVGFSNLEN